MIEEFVNQDISAGQNVGGRLSTFEEAALGTGGFHTGTLDAGVLPGHDEHERRTSSSSDLHSSGRGSSQGSYGSSQGSYGSSQGSYGSSSGSNQGGAYGSYQSHSSRSSGGGGGGSTSYQQSSYPAGSVGRSHSSRTYSSEPSSDTVITQEYYGAPTHSSPQHLSNLEPVENKFKHYDRYKRQIDDHFMRTLLTQCNNTNCAGLRCQIGSLPKDEYIYVAIRMRILSQTVKKVMLFYKNCLIGGNMEIMNFKTFYRLLVSAH